MVSLALTLIIRGLSVINFVIWERKAVVRATPRTLGELSEVQHTHTHTINRVRWCQRLESQQLGSEDKRVRSAFLAI